MFLETGLDHRLEACSAGSVSRDFTICLSPQCRASSRGLLGKKSKGGGGVVTIDQYIIIIGPDKAKEIISVFWITSLKI